MLIVPANAEMKWEGKMSRGESDEKVDGETEDVNSD